MTAAAVADKVPEFWMVIAIKDGTQTPYNFQTEGSAQQFSKKLENDPGVVATKLWKMLDNRPLQHRLQNPIPYHSTDPALIIDTTPPIRGKPVRPNLTQGNRQKDWSTEELKISGLE